MLVFAGGTFGSESTDRATLYIPYRRPDDLHGLPFQMHDFLLGTYICKIVFFGTRGAKFLPLTSALARVEEQKFQLQVANITFWHE